MGDCIARSKVKRTNSVAENRHRKQAKNQFYRTIDHIEGYISNSKFSRKSIINENGISDHFAMKEYQKKKKFNWNFWLGQEYLWIRTHRDYLEYLRKWPHIFHLTFVGTEVVSRYRDIKRKTFPHKFSVNPLTTGY